MHINEEAVSFAAFSLAKILAAELLRKRILEREELISAICNENVVFYGWDLFLRRIALMASLIVATLSFTKIGRVPALTAVFASARV